jgi:hypothetical protein
MAAKKKRKRAVKRRRGPARKKSVRRAIKKEKSPNYMVQLGEPKMVRKDVLESIREVIIFMQGYEKFKSMQEEKTDMLLKLKEDVKELRNLIDNQLHKFLPKGKLRFLPLKKKMSHEEKKAVLMGEKKPVVPKPVIPAVPAKPEVQPAVTSELYELEKQLNDIENQLRTIR